MTFSSTDTHEFAIIKPSAAQGGAGLEAWSDFPFGEGEYDLYISAPYLSGVENLVEDAGLEFVKLPKGTELKLEGTVKRHIPVGLQSAFVSTSVNLKAKVGADTVWVGSGNLAVMADDEAPNDARQKLIALSLVDSKDYLYVGDKKWKCPK